MISFEVERKDDRLHSLIAEFAVVSQYTCDIYIYLNRIKIDKIYIFILDL